MRTTDGGEIKGFVVAYYGNPFAIIRYGNRLRMIGLDEIELVDEKELAEAEAEDESYRQSVAAMKAQPSRPNPARRGWHQ